MMGGCIPNMNGSDLQDIPCPVINIQYAVNCCVVNLRYSMGRRVLILHLYLPAQYVRTLRISHTPGCLVGEVPRGKRMREINAQIRRCE